MLQMTGTQIRSVSEAIERHAEVGSSSSRVNRDVLTQTDTLAPVDVNTGLLDSDVVLQSHFGPL